MSHLLKRFLLETYGGYGDKRLKGLDHDAPIQVDDRNQRDVSPDFCGIFVRVIDEKSLELVLASVPLNDAVRLVVKQRGGQVEPYDSGCGRIQLTVGLRDITFIRGLDRAVEAIVARGEKYPNPNWKWVCERVGHSLNQLANTLWTFRKRRKEHPVSSSRDDQRVEPAQIVQRLSNKMELADVLASDSPHAN